MTLGNFEPLAAAAVKDVQVNRTRTRRDFDDTGRRGMDPRCGGRMLLDLDVSRRGDDDDPTMTVENVPATRTVVMAALDDNIAPALVVVGACGRAHMPRLNLHHGHMPRRIVFMIVK